MGGLQVSAVFGPCSRKWEVAGVRGDTLAEGLARLPKEISWSVAAPLLLPDLPLAIGDAWLPA